MKVAVTSKSFSKNKILIDELSKYFNDIKLNYGTKKLNDNEVIEFLQDFDGAIVALEEINKKVIDSLPKLKVISKFGVGLDNIDQEYCKQKNIKIGWQGGVNKTSVAEMALGFMLMLIRNLYISSNKLSNNIWEKNGGYSLYGKTIGIIGVGHIGKELVKLLKPFNCKILVNDIIKQDKYYKDNNLIESTKDKIFKDCDIITLHVTLNEDTKFLVNKNSLSKMKDTAFLINTARGDIVNLNDLKLALKEKRISGAAIDVYDIEPPKDKELLSLENIICTPHIGGNSHEAVLAMGRSAIKFLKELTVNTKDEIDYLEYMDDKTNLNKYLIDIKLSNGVIFKTYEKLKTLENVFFEYYNNLQNSYGFQIDKNDLVIDIGAHHGIVSVGFAQMGAKVISYEPNPINFNILTQNINNNKQLNITAYENAVSNKNETLIFNFGKTSTTGALKELGRDWKRTSIDAEVKAIDLNNILNQHSNIKLLKIDCEGAEYDILYSLSKENIDKINYLYIEVHPVENHMPKDIEPILTNLGFIYDSVHAAHGCYEYFCKKG